MENNLKIPTLEDLKEKIKSNKLPYDTSEILLLEVIKLISKFANFRIFLQENNYDDDYELPYVIFWKIINYFKKCIEEWNIDEIKEILGFLDKKLQSHDKEVMTLVQLSVLENLDKYPEMLPDLFEIMPEYMKGVCIKYYLHYLR